MNGILCAKSHLRELQEKGYEATRQIRSLQRRDIAHMPIIVMTANAFSEDVTNAIKAGMNYHLAKPIDIGALMGILSKYLQAPA